MVTAEAPSRRFFRRARYDAQPTDPAQVLLASEGRPFGRPALEEAVRLAAGGRVEVVSVARMYGSAYGLPNPGLMPSKKELTEQREQVERVVKALRRKGIDSSGQVAIARSGPKVIAKAARAHGVQHVVLGVTDGPRWRRVVEGDPVKEIRRRCGSGIEVHGVPADR